MLLQCWGNETLGFLRTGRSGMGINSIWCGTKFIWCGFSLCSHLVVFTVGILGLCVRRKMYIEIAVPAEVDISPRIKTVGKPYRFQSALDGGVSIVWKLLFAVNVVEILVLLPIILFTESEPLMGNSKSSKIRLQFCS